MYYGYLVQFLYSTIETQRENDLARLVSQLASESVKQIIYVTCFVQLNIKNGVAWISLS